MQQLYWPGLCSRSVWSSDLRFLCGISPSHGEDYGLMYTHGGMEQRRLRSPSMVTIRVPFRFRSFESSTLARMGGYSLEDMRCVWARGLCSTSHIWPGQGKMYYARDSDAVARLD
jgi:hypothetical protein